MPSAGSASTSSPFARSIASIEPIRDEVDRLDGRHHPDPRPADPRPGRRSRHRRTCPSRGRGLRPPDRGAGRSAAGRSRCSRCPRCAGSGSARARTSATASLVDVLAMLPVIPTVERVEPAPPAGRDRPEGLERPGDPDDADRSRRLDRPAGPADEDGGGAVGGGLGEVLVAVGPLAGQGDEQVAGRDAAGIDRRAADRPAGIWSSCPPASRATSAGLNESLPAGGVGPDRSITAASVARPALTGSGWRGWPSRPDGRSSVFIASVAIRRKSSYHSTARGRSPCRMTSGLPSWISTAMTRSGAFRPM